MRKLCMVLVITIAGAADAKPLEIDLTPERQEYEVRATPRKVGLGLLLGTVALGAASAYGWTQAMSTRTSLLAQTRPVNLDERQGLVSQGQGLNILGLVTAIAGVVAGIGTAYFLAVSF